MLRLRLQGLFSSQLPRPYACINICATNSIMTALVPRWGPWNVLSAVWTPLGTDVSEHLFWTPKPTFPPECCGLRWEGGGRLSITATLRDSSPKPGRSCLAVLGHPPCKDPQPETVGGNAAPHGGSKGTGLKMQSGCVNESCCSSTSRLLLVAI